MLGRIDLALALAVAVAYAGLAVLDVPPPGAASVAELVGGAHGRNFLRLAGPERDRGLRAGGDLAGGEGPPEPLYLRPVAVAMAEGQGPGAKAQGPALDAGPLDLDPDADYRVVAPGPLSERSVPVRSVPVRLTFYVDRGTTRYGCPTLPGMAAVDPAVIRPGTIFRVRGSDRLYYACDTGRLVRGAHVDLWMPSEAAGWEYLARQGDRVEIEILQEVN